MDRSFFQLSIKDLPKFSGNPWSNRKSLQRDNTSNVSLPFYIFDLPVIGRREFPKTGTTKSLRYLSYKDVLHFQKRNSEHGDNKLVSRLVVRGLTIGALP